MAKAHLTPFKLASISLCLFILLSSALSTQIATADETLTVSIASPNSSSTQNGKFLIEAVTASNSTNPDGIRAIGIGITGLSSPIINESWLLDFIQVVDEKCDKDCYVYARSNDANKKGEGIVWAAPYSALQANGKFLFSFDATRSPFQKYEIRIFAGNSVSKTIQVTTESESTSVKITSPISGSSQKGKVTITALTASKNKEPTKISQIGIRFVGLSAEIWQDDVKNLEILLAECEDCEGSFDNWPIPTPTYARSWRHSYPGNGKLTFSLDLSTLPYQEYEVQVFTRTLSNVYAVSNTIRFTKTRESIKTVTPKIICKTIESFVGRQSNISCTSNYELPLVPISLEYKVGNSWQTLSSGNFRGTNDLFTDTGFKIGATTARITSAGLKKQLDPYGTNIQVNPFISNEFIVNTVAAPKPKTDTSAPKSSSTKAKQKWVCRFVKVPTPGWTRYIQGSMGKEINPESEFKNVQICGYEPLP
ncbi:MAG: hypothetical protein D4R50_01310 [Actinomycetales bacterium]|nr:MAG: hypothetical protein D4R50_01310 [Actinomycetales bacterium]